MSETENKDISSSPSAIARLNWEEKGVQKTQPIASNGLTIGRSSKNNLALNDLSSSRFHCKILPESGGLITVDLDSTNGTYVNGVRISESHPIHDGDELKIGDVEFQVEVLIAEPEEALPEGIPELPLEETYVMPTEEEFPWLMVSSGTGRGTVFPLTKKKMEIGRASRNKQWDIDLVDRSVSRPHAELTRRVDEWSLTDLGSANGTRVNGEDVTETVELKDGDVIEFGETVLIFRAGKGA